MRGDDDSNFDDTDLIADEILKAKAYGVQSIIEVTCCDMGRDGKLLQEYGRRCGIHIVAATGYYLEPYHTDWVKESPVEALAEQFCRDILSGIDGTDCKAGVIGEVATSEPDMAPSEEKVLIAAAMANLMWLMERGYEDKIMLSQDISRKSYLSAAGRYSGYMAVMKDFIPMLKARGLTEETQRKLLVENPARIFDRP